MITALLAIVAFILGVVVGRMRIKKVLLRIENSLNAIDISIDSLRVYTNKNITRDDISLVYYGPHACQVCDPIGTRGTLIVKAGNGAPDHLEFDFPSEEAIALGRPAHWLYPNSDHGRSLTWKTHKHLKVNKIKKTKSK